MSVIITHSLHEIYAELIRLTLPDRQLVYNIGSDSITLKH